MLWQFLAAYITNFKVLGLRRTSCRSVGSGRKTTLLEAPMKWIIRKNIKVDRVACRWLIRRFIAPDAEFLFVEEDQLLRTAAAAPRGQAESSWEPVQLGGHR